MTAACQPDLLDGNDRTYQVVHDMPRGINAILMMLRISRWLHAAGGAAREACLEHESAQACQRVEQFWIDACFGTSNRSGLTQQTVCNTIQEHSFRPSGSSSPDMDAALPRDAFADEQLRIGSYMTAMINANNRSIGQMPHVFKPLHQQTRPHLVKQLALVDDVKPDRPGGKVDVEGVADRVHDHGHPQLEVLTKGPG